jgi:hypothetical protein
MSKANTVSPSRAAYVDAANTASKANAKLRGIGLRGMIGHVHSPSAIDVPTLRSAREDLLDAAQAVDDALEALADDAQQANPASDRRS